MRLPDGRCLCTTTCGIRIKWPSGRRTPLYYTVLTSGMSIAWNICISNITITFKFSSECLSWSPKWNKFKRIFGRGRTTVDRRWSPKNEGCFFAQLVNGMARVSAKNRVAKNKTSSRKMRTTKVVIFKWWSVLYFFSKLQFLPSISIWTNFLNFSGV